MGCFTYDGVNLEDYVEVVAVEMPPIPRASADLREVSGMDGAAYFGNVLEPLEIAVTARLSTDVIDERDIQREWARLASMLRKDSPRPLKLTEDRYWNAVFTGQNNLDFTTYSATAQLTFTCPDPISYGVPESVTVPSGGSVEFEVGGTYPTMPRIEVSAVRDTSSGLWGVRLDDGDFLHVATGANAARKVKLDCADRTCIVNGNVALPTLDSDWLVLEPGTHTLANDLGTGAATVTWIERWL